MGALFGGGGGNTTPAYSQGTGLGGTAYVPAAQPQADTTYQNILNQLSSQGLQNVQQLGSQPTGQYWPEIQGAAQQYFANPYAGTAQDAAGSVGAIGGGGIADLASFMQSVINPYYPQAIAGAQTGAAAGTAAAGQAESAAAAGAGIPGQVAGLAGQVAAPIPTLQAGGRALLQTGYDPQNALFDRLQGQNIDQSNVFNSMYGLGSSPYGAGVAGQNLSNFDINWQNNLLNRQATALQGAGGAFTQAGNLGTGAGNLYAQSPQIAAQNLALGGAAGNLFANAAALPANAFQQQFAGDIQNLAGVNQLAPSSLSLAQAPYTTSIGQAGNAFTGLNQLQNFAGNQYALPQQSLNDLQSYLGLGQAGSQLSAGLGNQGFGQNLTQLLGLGALGNTAGNLFGGSSGLGGAFGSFGSPAIQTATDFSSGAPSSGLFGWLGSLFGPADAALA